METNNKENLNGTALKSNLK